MVEGEPERQIVELLGGDAWLDVLGEHVERRGCELAGLAHAGERLRSVPPDLPFAAGCATNFHVRHVLFLSAPSGPAFEM